MSTAFTTCLLVAFALLAQGAPSSPRDVSDNANEGLLNAFAPNVRAWSTGASSAYSVWGDTCNTTQLEVIGDGLAQVQKLAEHSREHLRRYGNDTHFQKWFGNNNDPNTLQGLFDRIVSGDKGNVSFTCDDIDNTCNGKYGIIPGYFSSSVPELTVVCPTYYLSKTPLDHLCTAGKTIASQGSEATEGGWFLHRLLHLPLASGGLHHDVVDTAHEAVDLAQSVNTSQAIHNIHSVQYYALDVYAADLLLPGEGCLGDTSVEVKAAERKRHATYWMQIRRPSVNSTGKPHRMLKPKDRSHNR